MTVKLIKYLTGDFSRFKYIQPMPIALDLPTLETYRQACHQRGHTFGVQGYAVDTSSPVSM